MQMTGRQKTASGQKRWQAVLPARLLAVAAFPALSFLLLLSPAFAEDTHGQAPASAAESAGGGGGGGFPQLDVSSYSSQIFWLAVSFAALYLVMSRIALPGVAAVLEMRQQQKTADLDLAEKLNAEAEKARTALETSLAKARDEAQKLLSAADLEITTLVSYANTRFGQDARRRIDEAERLIAAARDAALQEVGIVAADLAASAASRIAPQVKISEAQLRKAVETATAAAAGKDG